LEHLFNNHWSVNMTETVNQVFATKVRINRGMGGNYGWEITAYGDDWEAEIDVIDNKLRAKQLNDNVAKGVE